MPHEILQQFLKQNLLDLGEDNARWKYLTDTADQVSSALLQDRSQLIPALLVALDPECPVDEPIFDLVEDQLMERWPLLRQKYIAERPRQVLRAILLQAIAEAQRSAPEVGAVVWLAGSSYLSSVSALSNSFELRIETKVVQESLSIFEGLQTAPLSDKGRPRRQEKVEQVAESEASEQDVNNESVPSFKESDFTNQSALTMIWASFLGQHYKNTEIPKKLKSNPYPIYRYYNSVEFVNEFAPRVAAFFIKFIALIRFQIAEQVDTQTRTSLERFNQELENQLKSAQLTEVKNAILWWKNALYSPRLRITYRQMPALQAAICMAADLADIVPPIYPIGVDFVLAETVRDLLRTSGYSGGETLRFLEVTEIGRETSSVDVLKVVISQGTVPSGRGSLLNYIQIMLQYPTSTALEIKVRVGVTPDTEIAVTDLAIWIFRDIQAQKLVASASRGDKS